MYDAVDANDTVLAIVSCPPSPPWCGYTDWPDPVYAHFTSVDSPWDGTEVELTWDGDGYIGTFTAECAETDVTVQLRCLGGSPYMRITYDAEDQWFGASMFTPPPAFEWVNNGFAVFGDCGGTVEVVIDTNPPPEPFTLPQGLPRPLRTR